MQREFKQFTTKDQLNTKEDSIEGNTGQKRKQKIEKKLTEVGPSLSIIILNEKD